MAGSNFIQRLLPQRLGWQLLTLFSLLLSVAMGSFIYYGVSQQTQHRETAMKLQARVLTSNLAATSAGYMLTRDYTSIELSLLRAAQYPGILVLQVCDAEGNLLGDVVHNAGTEPTPRYATPRLNPPQFSKEYISIDNNRLTVWQPMILGELLGWVKVQYSMQEISNELRAVWGNNAIVGLIILLIAGTILFFSQRKTVNSINSYTEFADRLDDCKGQQTEVNSRCFELKTLGGALNHVSKRLHEQSQEIAEAMNRLQRTAAFAEHAPYLILSIDDKGEIQYTNPYLQHTLFELEIDRPSLNLLLPEDINNMVNRTIEQQTTLANIEVNFQGRSITWTIAPVKDQPLVHAYGVDETERKQAEEKARSALVDKLSAVAANKAKSQFLANMSHELRTPLNAIIGYSEMLEEEAQDAGYNDLSPDLIMIRNAGKHLLTLINEILDLSKIEAGKMELSIEQFSIDELVQEVLMTAHTLVAKNGNRISAHIGNKLGKINSDQTKLRQILFNLISNASKFTENGDIDVYITRDKNIHGDWITLEVRDSGIGMSPEQIERVFEPFSQADSSTTRKYGGTGLGLTITKRFCSMLGGDISVFSVLGKGTTFSAKIRANLNEQEENEQQSEVIANEARFAKNASKTLLERRSRISTVLVIDDDAIIRRLIKRFLTGHGFKVRTAPNGDSGLALARKINPSLITLDVMMPGVDGWTSLQQFKNDEKLKNTPIAMVTLLEEKDIAFSLGADDFLAKPIIWNDLLNLVKRWVRQQKNRSALLVTDNSDIHNKLSNSMCPDDIRLTKAYSVEICPTYLENELPTIILLDPNINPKDGKIIMNSLSEQDDFKEIFVAAIGEYGNATWIPNNTEVIPLDMNNPEQFLADTARLLEGKLNQTQAA